MAKFRFLALQEIARRKPVECGERPRCSVVFGENVFSMDKMRHYLSIEAYKKLEKAMSEGLAIDRGLADQVAAAMKAWAVERLSLIHIWPRCILIQSILENKNIGC